VESELITAVDCLVTAEHRELECEPHADFTTDFRVRLALVGAQERIRPDCTVKVYYSGDSVIPLGRHHLTTASGEPRPQLHAHITRMVRWQDAPAP
jgi:hypothetical protein